jgi:hypothetical protein
MNGRRLLTAGRLVSTLEHDKKLKEYQSARPADGLKVVKFGHRLILRLNSEF